MPTKETQIWLALQGRLESLVLEPAHPMAWPNETFTPPQGGNPIKPLPYLKVQHLPNSTDRLMIFSTGKHRFKGILQVSVMAVLNQSNAISVEVAGKVADHFPVDAILTYGDVRVRVTKRPDIAQGMPDTAASRWQVPVTIYYECFA